MGGSSSSVYRIGPFRRLEDKPPYQLRFPEVLASAISGRRWNAVPTGFGPVARTLGVPASVKMQSSFFRKNKADCTIIAP